jgi:hypothetical protein
LITPNATTAVISTPLTGGTLTNPAAGCPTAPKTTVGCHAVQYSLAETQAIAAGTTNAPGCKDKTEKDATLLEEPVADPGHVCAYTGVEEKSTVAAPMGKGGINRANGEAGLSPNGGVILFEQEEIAPAVANIKTQGTWARAE